jgi:hypothetical protein
MTHAWSYISGIFSSSLFTMSELFGKKILLILPAFIVMEWLSRNNQYAIENIPIKNHILRWSFYVIITVCIVEMVGESVNFIYFQF